MKQAEPGHVRPRLVRATADGRVCALCCSGEIQLVGCQAQGSTQAHNSSSLQAPPQSIPVEGKRTEECPSNTSLTLPRVLGYSSSSHMQANTNVNTCKHCGGFQIQV